MSRRMRVNVAIAEATNPNTAQSAKVTAVEDVSSAFLEKHRLRGGYRHRRKAILNPSLGEESDKHVSFRLGHALVDDEVTASHDQADARDAKRARKFPQQKHAGDQADDGLVRIDGPQHGKI